MAVTVAGRTVITSTEGRFTAANVIPPYDVTAVLPSEEPGVSASAADGSVTGQALAIPDASTMQAFSFPPAPALVAPADATTGVDDSTVFSLTPGFAGVHRVYWQDESSGANEPS